MISWERNVNILAILTIIGVLTSAFGVQFLLHEEPCPLCLLQRLGMLGVVCSLLLNVRFSIHASHYGLALLSSLVGGTVALRQITLHVCPGTVEFGVPVLGLSLYTWSFLVFASTVLGVALLLLIFDGSKREEPLKPFSKLTVLTFIASTLVLVINIIATFFQCGFGPCQD